MNYFIHTNDMLCKAITFTLTVPHAMMYYIPFCPRPAITITIIVETSDKLAQIQNGNASHEVDEKVRTDLSTMVISLFTTNVVRRIRSIHCSIVFDYHTSSDLFALDDELRLSSRFKALCNE